MIKGELSLGSLTAIMVYMGQLVGLQHRASWFFRTIATGIVSCRRIDDILTRSVLIRQKPKAKEAVFDKGGISLKGVRFHYDGKEPLFKNMELDIPGASCTALAGASGCGKTTILNLILRLYEPQAGGIFIDGYDIRELTFASLRRQIGIALQEPLLWNDTIENNMRYGKLSATSDEIARVSGICGIDSFIADLPKGYQTIVGEDSCKLSEGQKQRIAIARAIIKNPKIVILDEAMSSIDSAGETAIMENIRRSLKGATIIIISHRWCSIKNADRVCFVRGADEIATGKAGDLLKKDPRFHRLFADQIQER